MGEGEELVRFLSDLHRYTFLANVTAVEIGLHLHLFISLMCRKAQERITEIFRF